MRSQPTIPLTCPVCDNVFLAWPYQVRQGRRFCNPTCRARGSTPRAPLADRLWSKVQIGEPSECWPFTGALNAYGYGVISRRRQEQGSHLAHRVAYELTFGAIPSGQILMHDCDNPPCCNPLHLTPGTYSQNLRDAIARLPRRSSPVRGSANALAKLTEVEVSRIRQEWDPDNPHTAREIAARYRVTADTIRMIVKRKSWRHI